MSEHSFVERPGSLAFDSTQTLRALSPSEIRDPNQQKWFVVQLAVSDRPVNLETMPRLDVFAAYRLYAVEGRSGSGMCHCLRLGFFDEEHSAQTICGYVKTFFRSPSVVRVSAAERMRFQPAAHPGEPFATATPPSDKVVELASVRANNRANVKNAVNTTATSQPQKTAGDSRQVMKNKSLAQELIEEARQIELSKSGRHRVAKQTASWFSRLLGSKN